MTPVVLSGNSVPAPRTGGEPSSGEPDCEGEPVPARLPRAGGTAGRATTSAGRAGASAGRTTASVPAGSPAPPPVRPTVVLAGAGHRDLAVALLDTALPAREPAAYLVLRHGPGAVRAFIPGHRAPRDLAAQGPPTRPPRRVAMSAPVPLLEYVHLVVAPETGPETAAGAAVLADAVRGADGLVYLLDAGAPAPAELAELATAAGRLVLVATRPTTAADRAGLIRQVPAAAGARWYGIDDVPALAAELSTGRWLGVETDLTPGAVSTGGAGGTVTEDDEKWRQVLSGRLAECRAAVDRRFAADLDAMVARCGGNPTTLPQVLDTELHALSLQVSAALDAVARELVGAVFAAVVAGRLGEADLVRVTTALWRQIDPDDRTLLVTSTAGVAVVTGAADALSATGLTPPALLPPVCLAVSGNCHLMWHYRGVPDRVEARRWLGQAADAVRGTVGQVLDARFATLGEAVEALAAEAVDHGVLLA
jgi:hypothetical protein